MNIKPHKALNKTIKGPITVMLLAFLLDQAHKVYFLQIRGWTGGERVDLTPFFQHVLVWNEGISYGLLGFAGSWLLIALTGVMIIFLGIWFVRDTSQTARYGLALAIGGAAGNLVDRVAYGAVADFFHFHHDTFSWYVFNIADIAIFLGAALLASSIFFDKKSPEKP